ncbi:MAG: hypothetical protein IPJ77_19560 [Planctomycetes bacterium]|nr:hypothetical protein [Planctomycetota bacterium]
MHASESRSKPFPRAPLAVVALAAFLASGARAAQVPSSMPAGPAATADHATASARFQLPLPREPRVVARYLVVLEAALAETDYARAADELARYRGATVWRWSGELTVLEAELRARRPEFLAFVLAPGSIDANLPRRLVPVLARLDDDPFVDCAWGIVTGATGAEALRFVQNAQRADGNPPSARKVSATSVQVDRCLVLRGERRAGAEGRALDQVDLWLTGQDPLWRATVEANRGEQAGAALVEWGHCGDSQGIWLFSMYRNMDASKHWPFDPARVGHDPAGEMPRLTPELLLGGAPTIDRNGCWSAGAGVDLGGAVVINGACHSAVTKRTIVGGDIVSTFGDTGGVVRFFDVTPEQSFALQAIRHGAAAYLAPLAANHASRASIEEWRIRAGGVPLGEVVRRSYDELVLGASQLPMAFATYAEGKPDPFESPMWTGVVQRVLFGDPAACVWTEPILTPHRVTTEWVEPGRKLRVDVAWENLREDPFVWDPWVQAWPSEPRDRVYERVPLGADVGAIAKVTVVKAETGGGASLDLLKSEPKAMLDRDAAGKPVLHVIARWPRLESKDGQPALPKRVRFLFEVEFTPRDG